MPKQQKRIEYRLEISPGYFTGAVIAAETLVQLNNFLKEISSHKRVTAICMNAPEGWPFKVTAFRGEIEGSVV